MLTASPQRADILVTWDENHERYHRRGLVGLKSPPLALVPSVGPEGSGMPSACALDLRTEWKQKTSPAIAAAMTGPECNKSCVHMFH